MIYLVSIPNTHIRGWQVLGYFLEYPDQETIKSIVDPENEEEAPLRDNIDYRIEQLFQLEE